MVTWLLGHWLRREISSGDGVGLDGPQSLAETPASLPQELERVCEGALRGGALQISLVLFDEVCLQGRSNLVGRLECLIDCPFPRDVVDPHGRLRLDLDRVPTPPSAGSTQSTAGRASGKLWVPGR